MMGTKILQRKKTSPIRYADDMSDLALSVIGLWHMGVRDFRTMCRLLGVGNVKREEYLLRVIDCLHRTGDELVRRWVDAGLPAGVCAPLAKDQSVMCRLCHHRVHSVPCPICSLKSPETRRPEPEPPHFQKDKPKLSDADRLPEGILP